MTALERRLKRALTEGERAIVTACGPLSALAEICIVEHISLHATRKIVALVNAYVDLNARHAAKLAADLVAAERMAPGSMTTEGKGETRN